MFHNNSLLSYKLIKSVISSSDQQDAIVYPTKLSTNHRPAFTKSRPIFLGQIRTDSNLPEKNRPRKLGRFFYDTRQIFARFLSADISPPTFLCRLPGPLDYRLDYFTLSFRKLKVDKCPFTFRNFEFYTSL